MIDQRLKWIKVRMIHIFLNEYNQSINRKMKTEKEQIRIAVTLIHLL